MCDSQSGADEAFGQKSAGGRVVRTPIRLYLPIRHVRLCPTNNAWLRVSARPEARKVRAGVLSRCGSIERAAARGITARQIERAPLRHIRPTAHGGVTDGREDEQYCHN